MMNQQRNRGWVLALAILACLPAWAQAPTAPSPSSPSSAPATPPPVAPRAGSGPATSSDLAQMREQIAGVDRSVRDAIATVRPNWWERIMPALIGLFGVLVGGLLSTWQQRRQMALSVELQKLQLREGERIGRAQAGFDALSKVVDYQTKQVNEFYYPLRLMLRRSSGVRRQLCDQLHAKAPARFVYVDEGDGREHLFVAEHDARRTRFRLIEHMHEIATQHAEFLPLVQEIVSIGNTMSELIHSKGGMAIAGSESLTSLLGRYLAHFSILRDVANKAVHDPAVLATVRYNVAYPVELDEALDTDIATLTAEIDSWKALSLQMWHQVATTPGPGEPNGLGHPAA